MGLLLRLLLLGRLVLFHLGIVVCGVVRVIRWGGRLSRIGRLATGQLFDEVFDGLSLWIIERGEGRGGPRVLSTGCVRGWCRCGLLLYYARIGSEGVERGDELEHGLARGRGGLLLGLGYGDGLLGWGGQLAGWFLGPVGVCGVEGFRQGLLDGCGGGGREGRVWVGVV